MIQINNFADTGAGVRRKAVLFVPFWRMAGHVGNNRVDRFVRWLAEDGYELVIVRAGAREAARSESWGQEITVVDRLGLHPEAELGQARAVSLRKPNKLRRALAYWVFNPDPAIVWAKAAARHPKVIAAMQGATFILSSSPPESAHVGAWMLSQRTGVPHVMDMRDGWLDEPLKPLLHTSTLRRWQERRLESRIAHDANAIQVTSDVWKELFEARYPELTHKVCVLTNCYPPNMSPARPVRSKGPEEEYELVHAGRFIGSRQSQKPELLFEPLLKNLARTPSKGVIRCYGDLSADELTRIHAYQPRLVAIGWRVECLGAVPRAQMLDIMLQADGLLLLSASYAALPSKLFEYIPTGRPIFVVTEKNGATWKICANLTQASTNEFSGESAVSVLNNNSFFIAREYSMPMDLSEASMKSRFKLFLP